MKGNLVDQSTYENKLNDDSKVCFRMNIHGRKEGEIISYRTANNSLKTLIRRRIADNDGSVEIINPKIENPAKDSKKNQKEK